MTQTARIRNESRNAVAQNSSRVGKNLIVRNAEDAKDAEVTKVVDVY